METLKPRKAVGWQPAQGFRLDKQRRERSFEGSYKGLHFEGWEGCRLATYKCLGWLRRGGIETLKARKAVGWQPTGIENS